MTEFTMFQSLVAAVRALGVDIFAESRKRIAQLNGDGVLVEDEKDFVRTPCGIFHVLPDGRIVKVILHITQKSLYTSQVPPVHEWNKYHLFNCRTLEMMKAIGREQRYRMASRGDGKFRYTLLRHNRVLREYQGEDGAELAVCGNCRNIYNELFNRHRNRPLNLRQFIETNDLHGTITATYRPDHGDILNVYAQDWRQIASAVKEQRLWTCEQCGIVLSSPHLKRFLHAHHVDGQASNNVLTNIQILCIGCHAKQPLHSQVKSDPAFQVFQRTPEFQAHRAFGTRGGKPA